MGLAPPHNCGILSGMTINYRDPLWLAKAMEASGTTIADLAARSGISRDQIERLRKDATKTRVSTAHLLADSLAQAAA